MALLAPGPDRRRRRPDRRRRVARRRPRTSATRRSRSRTRTSPATRRGAAACDRRLQDRRVGRDGDPPPPGPDRRRDRRRRRRAHRHRVHPPLMSRFEWVADSARLLKATADEFDRTQPFKGLRIGTGIHLEPKTAALLMTLQRGGADVVSTGNLNSTQQETVDYLRDNGIDVIGGPTADPAEHDRFLRGVLADEAGPHPRQRRRPVRALPRGPVRRPARRDRGDDLRPRPAAAAARPARRCRSSSSTTARSSSSPRTRTPSGRARSSRSSGSPTGSRTAGG